MDLLKFLSLYFCFRFFFCIFFNSIDIYLVYKKLYIFNAYIVMSLGMYMHCDTNATKKVINIYLSPPKDSWCPLVFFCACVW